MHAPSVAREARAVPTWRFWIWTLLVAPVAAVAAALAGGHVGDETGVGVALTLLGLLLALSLAYERAVRCMPSIRRAIWVLVGLAVSAAAVMTTFLLLLWIAFSMTEWS